MDHGLYASEEGAVEGMGYSQLPSAVSMGHPGDRSTGQIDPLRQRSALAMLEQRRKPVALYNLQHELGQPLVGIEKYGYTVGGVFVLTPSVEDWEELVQQRLPSQRMGESGRPVRKKSKPLPEPFAGLELRAEYMGYGSWKRYLQHGAFMVVCLRCRPEAMTAAACRAVVEKLQHPMTAKMLSDVLRQRERRPFLSEFPVVGGADLQELPELLGQMQGRLEDIMGISTSMQAGVRVQADEGVLVRAITQATQTTAKPFVIVGAGPDAMCVKVLGVRPDWPEGEQGLVQIVPFRMGGLRPKGRDADKLVTQGNLDVTVSDAAVVALSFARAHGGWIESRYGLVIDPRKRIGQDYSFSISPITYTSSGPSGGMAYIVQMLLYLTDSSMPSEIFIMGTNSISGVTTPVHCYREKMLTLTRETVEGTRPNVILPTESIDRGVIVEQLIDLPRDQGTDPAQEASMYSQVRLPASLVKNIRVLGVDNIFNCIELCIPAKNPAVTRPIGHVAGLAVAKAIWPSSSSLRKPSVTLVEAFLFPGNGQIIATASSEGNKNIARLGVTLVNEQWQFFMEDHPGTKHRTHPDDKVYDLHVNVVGNLDTPVGVGSAAWAAAAAYMALLIGIEVPAHVAFLGEPSNTCHISSPGIVNQALIETAQEHGITTIFTGTWYQAADEAFLTSLTAEQRGDVQIIHHDKADKILPFLSGNTDPAAALPDLPAPFKDPGGASESQGGTGS